MKSAVAAAARAVTAQCARLLRTPNRNAPSNGKGLLAMLHVGQTS